MAGRPCDRCGEPYNKTSTYNKLCSRCIVIAGALRDTHSKRTVFLDRIFKSVKTNQQEASVGLTE